jgi:predicted negative regulator of RcsB-dependent stress response
LNRITRKELKTDPFASEVQHTLEYVNDHRSQVVRYGSIAVGIAVLAGAWYFYSQHQHVVRQEKLAEVFRINDANVGPSDNAFTLSYPTEQAKDQALVKALTELAVQYGGSAEGTIAQYMLAAHAADKGNAKEAERRLRDVVDNGKGPYVSLAAVQLARIYGFAGRIADARALLQPIIDKPTVFVSKEEAELVLAKILGPTKPDEARKILDRLKSQQRAAISQTAIAEAGELLQK